MQQDSQLPITIDFLPEHYHEEGVKQRTQVWRLVVVVLLGSTIAAASLYQAYLKRRAETELVVVENQHVLAVSQTTQLVTLQTELAPARTTAELLTYLRHPWPRTQIIAVALRGLSDPIVLTELQVVRENQQAAPAPVEISLNAADPKQAKPAGVDADLARLHAENDTAVWSVNLKGITYETAALHEYLKVLGQQPLFKRIELGSITTSAQAPGASQFSVRLMLSPGYGQPSGPGAAPVAANADGATLAKAPTHAQ